MKKKKKIKISFVLKTIVVLIALSSMLLNSILGVTKSEYFKSLSKNLDFEVGPDLALRYYVYDYSGTGVATRRTQKGVYKNSKSFSQEIIVGQDSTALHNSGIYSSAEWNSAQSTAATNTGKYPDNPTFAANNVKYTGEKIIYQIKLPVDETGYFNLNFQVDFLVKHATNGGGWCSDISEFFVQNYDRAVGCEILNHNDGFAFEDSTKTLSLWTSSDNDTVYSESKKAGESNENIKYLYADSGYQWKTLSPSRAEKVSLTYKVETQDVTKGYVIWMWELSGLYGGRTWKMDFTDVSVEKIMELDGSTKSRESSVDPYFMFPQAYFVNNQHVLSLTNTNDAADYDYPTYKNASGETVTENHIRSVQHRGKTSYSKGRGTFATSATDNSLTFQAESLFYGHTNSDSMYSSSGGGSAGFLNELDKDSSGNNLKAFSNPVVVSIPLKNIQFDTTYKVTFDLSVARQGTYELTGGGEGEVAINKNQFTGIGDSRGLSLVSYANPNTDMIFRDGTKLFSSYLLASNTQDRRTEVTHIDNMTKIKYANKSYEGTPLTKYDEINSLLNLNRSITQSVNNTYCNENNQTGDNESSKSRNWFNAVQHVEYNGQNKINWLTFYNTTFSFNIPESQNKDLKLNELNWVWAMDSLISGCYYRIKLENVRIERVVDYTSNLAVNGIKIAGTPISLENHTVPYGSNLGYRDEDKVEGTQIYNIFRCFRGINGTGQQYQAKGFVLDEITSNANKVYTSEGNIYAPIIDATSFTVRPDKDGGGVDADGNPLPADNAYELAISGFTVCKGGVDRYVFSVDGGKTWQDMIFTGTKANADQLNNAEKGINQHASGQTRYDESKFTAAGADIDDYTHIDFTTTNGDDINASFTDFNLVVNLKNYATQANLDIIIAAVPLADSNARCEIVRIINFNQVRNYMTFPFDFVSDITVNTKNGTSILNVNRLDESSAAGMHGTYYDDLVKPEATGFTFVKTWILNNDSGGSGPEATTGYARMNNNSYKYEDIRTLWYDMPVKTTLGVTGRAMVEGGVQNYYWSADYGKTWTKCGGTPKTRELVSPQYKKYYYDGVAVNYNKAEDEAMMLNSCFRDSIDGNFNGAQTNVGDNKGQGSMLTANLSAYEGQVVDVIFAAKPTQSDVYVPVGRIDNVAVYGANGMFYSEIQNVQLDNNLYKDENHNNELYMNSYWRSPLAIKKDITGKYLDKRDTWNVLYGYMNNNEYIEYGKEGTTPTGTAVYSIFEVNNVDVRNIRLYNISDYQNLSTSADKSQANASLSGGSNTNLMQSGGRVSLSGAVVCDNGVNRFKYSLDAGETWTVINFKTPYNVTENTGSLKRARAFNPDFTLDDAKSGNFYSAKPCVGTDGTTTRLEFNLPALPEGAERDLLVVAESNKVDADGNIINEPSGKLFPVIRMRLKFTNYNAQSRYGYMRSEDAYSSAMGWIEENQVWTFTPTPSNTIGINNSSNRITIPVTETGEHTLTFTHTIDNGPSENSIEGKAIYKTNGERDGAKSSRTADTYLKANKTHYLVGEEILVDFGWKANESTKDSVKDKLMVAIVSEDWKNQYDNQHAIYSKSYEVGNTADYKDIIIQDFINLNSGLAPDVKNLKAGSYRIFLIHRGTWNQSNSSVKVDGLKDLLHWNNTRNRYILAQTLIYIHDVDEKVEFSVVHDDGEYTYFSDITRQFTSTGESKAANADHIYTLEEPFAENTRTITATVNVTRADVKRGYIVLDTNYTGLWSANEHTKAQCEAVNGVPNAGEVATLPDGTSLSKEEAHTDDVCVSRDENNDSTFTKKVVGDLMYAVKNYSDGANGDVKNTYYHKGITYNIKITGVSFEHK